MIFRLSTPAIKGLFQRKHGHPKRNRLKLNISEQLNILFVMSQACAKPGSRSIVTLISRDIYSFRTCTGENSVLEFSLKAFKINFCHFEKVCVGFGKPGA